MNRDNAGKGWNTRKRITKADRRKKRRTSRASKRRNRGNDRRK